MANELNMVQRDRILTLLGQGLSKRKIALLLGLHRDTVRRYACQFERRGTAGVQGAPEHQEPVQAQVATGSGPAPVPKQATLGQVATGSEAGEEAAKAATLDKVATGSEQVPAAPAPPLPDPPAVQPGRSKCEPFQSIIETKLAAGLTAQRIFQDLVGEHGFTGAYNSVKRFVRRLGAAQEWPFRRMECEPGAEAQLDFGSGAPVSAGPDGEQRRTHVLRLVLSHSRKAYCEAFFRQTTENLLACCENAFAAWGGVPRTLVVDNTRAAVLRADWYDPEVHPRLAAFCKHYGTVLLPTKPRMPRHKGKVEAGIKYVKSNALQGRVFESLMAQNTHLADWESHVADLRIHGTTKRQVRQVFEECERPALLPLPQERFPFFHEDQRTVHLDGHVEVEKSYYSVPPEYLRRTVWVRWDSRMVRIFNAQFVEIALHPRAPLGGFSTAPEHIASQKRSRVEQGATALLRRARLIGPQTGRWAEAMLKMRGIEGVRVLVGLLGLVRTHSSGTLERACELALGHGAFHLREVRALLKEPLEQQQMEFMSEHAVIRSIKAYGELVQVSFDEERPWIEPPVQESAAASAATEEPGA